jgi:protocatechuate 3,4-dioxygenase, beta subunit
MKAAIFGFLILIFFSCRQTTSQRQHSQDTTQKPADSCDNPDAGIGCCFVNMPKSLSSTMTITKQNEDGEKLIISGTVYQSDGKSAYPNVILYAYHTDSKGHYSKSGTETGFQKWHGRFHGWCKTDNNGHYKIQTIRPAPYPDNSMPAHIHLAIKKENGEMYWINDFVFKDDKLVNEKYLSSLVYVGGTGIVDLKKNADNSWTGKRDIILK